VNSQATTLQALEPHQEIGITISWGKLMMWLFLCSDAMSFGGLIAAYASYRVTDPAWPNPQEILGITLTGIMTFILIVSSVTMVKALAAAKTGDLKAYKRFMLFTVLGGLFFLGCQAYEWTHLIEHGAEHPVAKGGLILSHHQFAATFFVLTGFHGAHVTGGVIYNLIMYFLGRKGRFNLERSGPVEVAGLYWHFVDLVWILIFTFVYLI